MPAIEYVYNSYSPNEEQNTWNAYVDGKHVIICGIGDCPNLQVATLEAIKKFHPNRNKEEMSRIFELVNARTSRVHATQRMTQLTKELQDAQKEYYQYHKLVMKLQTKYGDLEK